jgi:hypothetical protein
MSATGIQAGQLENFYGALEAVSVISTSNITLSGLQNINGATGADGDRVLVTGQTTATEDGIYIMRAAAWERAADADDDGGFTADLGGMLVRVEDGTDAGKFYVITNARGAGVVATDQLSVSLAFDPGATTPNRVFGEEATFTPGTFTATVANDPTDVTLRVYRNGVRLQEGAGNDYTQSGVTLTFTRRLRPNDKILVDYEY